MGSYDAAGQRDIGEVLAVGMKLRIGSTGDASERIAAVSDWRTLVLAAGRVPARAGR
jgi:hypothetical protein